MSLESGSRCPKCVEKKRRHVGILEFEMGNPDVLVCNHDGKKFTRDGREIKT